MAGQPTISLFFTDEATIPQAIARFFTRSWCSHVDVVMPNGALLGARPNWEANGGVQVRLPGYHDFTRSIAVELPCDAAVVNAFYAFCQEQIGKPYDWRADVMWFSSRDWSKPNSWMCSELIAAGLVASGYFERLYVTASRISPADLLLMLSTRVPIGALMPGIIFDKFEENTK